MGKTKIFTVLGKLTAGALIPEALNQGAKILKRELEKRQDYVKIPDVTGLPVEEAALVLEKYGFQHSLIKATASPQFSNSTDNQVIKLVPRAKSNVPATTFLKVYYVDSATISESVILANKIREMKAIKKEKNHKNMQKIVQQTTKVTEKLTKKRHVSK